MVEKLDGNRLSEILKAVSDTTRRELLTQLVQQGPTRVTDLAAVYAMSLNAISKHIKVLEKAQLVRRKTRGRDHWIEAELQPLRDAEAWFAQLKSIWALRLEKLDEILNQEDNNHD